VNLANPPVPPPLVALIRAIKGRDYAGRYASRANAFLGDLDLDSAKFNLWAVVMREGGHQVYYTKTGKNRALPVLYVSCDDALEWHGTSDQPGIRCRWVMAKSLTGNSSRWPMSSVNTMIRRTYAGLQR
jgi:hypothetical protein